MKRIIQFACIVLTVSTAANAQTAEETIARAVSAAPAGAQADASVVTWDADGNREMLREGSNDFICWDRSGQNPRRAFFVQCTNKGNLARYEQNLAFSRAGNSREEVNALGAAAEENGTRELPVFGSIYYYNWGDDQESATPHMTVTVPYATHESLSLPAERTGGVLFLMQAGTASAHLMVTLP